MNLVSYSHPLSGLGEVTPSASTQGMKIGGKIFLSALSLLTLGYYLLKNKTKSNPVKTNKSFDKIHFTASDKKWLSKLITDNIQSIKNKKASGISIYSNKSALEKPASFFIKNFYAGVISFQKRHKTVLTIGKASNRLMRIEGGSWLSLGSNNYPLVDFEFYADNFKSTKDSVDTIESTVGLFI